MRPANETNFRIPKGVCSSCLRSGRERTLSKGTNGKSIVCTEKWKLLTDDDGLLIWDAVNADDKQEQKIRCPTGVCQDANALGEVQDRVPSRRDNQSSRSLIIQGVALSKLRCMQCTRNDPAYPQRRSWVGKRWTPRMRKEEVNSSRDGTFINRW